MTQLIRLTLVAASITALLPGQEPKKKITRAADVPVFNYPISGKVEDVVLSDEAFAKLSAQIRRDIESVLAQYDIEETATKRNLIGTLAALDVLEGKDQDALRRLDEVRELQDKPGQKLISGIVSRAIVEARAQYKDPNSPEYRRAVYKLVREKLDTLPFAVVQDDVKGNNAQFEILSKGIIIGSIQSVLDPVVQRNGSLSSDMAFRLPSMKLALTDYLPLKDTLAEAFGSYLAANRKEKPDIWAARAVQLDPGKGYAPVNVAVWDSGVDTGIFKDQLIRDDGQPAVIAYDLYMKKTTGDLYPFPPDRAAKIPESRKRVKGFLDLQANVDSPEASAIKKQVSGLQPSEMRPFFEQVSEVADYMHGTHVAGILMAGNPYARLVVGRITFDYKMIPDPCPSKELSERSAAAAMDYINFFKAHHVRVVNMSWGGSVKDEEGALEQCGIGSTPDDRKRMAREIFDIEKHGLEAAFASAPDILFVTAGGNANNDASFNEFIPSSIRAPNLITAGAVDRSGDEAPFTSYGPTVVVDANGYEVDSYVPGGERMKFSGTSMASPNVANLAAKIIAVDPRLTPPEVIEIIRTTADRTADGRRNLINPVKAVAAAERAATTSASAR